jgi:glutamate-1-semialdehyde aminotransferase
MGRALSLFVKSAKGAHFTDFDNRDDVDLCLGDTGAMTGHSPDVVVDVVGRQARQGITVMLPAEDSLWVGEEPKRMIELAKRFTHGIGAEIRTANLSWNVTRPGARAEYTFTPHAPRNGSESYAVYVFELERFLHIYSLNRGVLLTPFHNTALVCPATTESDVGEHTKVFAAAIQELVS